MLIEELPHGDRPPPIPAPHFPSRLHAFVWRNWSLVPLARMAEVVGARSEDVAGLGRAMGLPEAADPSEDAQRRSSVTVIRRNWHLLPYEQLLELLDWPAERLSFTLREDDFLFMKLGLQKPDCAPLEWAEGAGLDPAASASVGRRVRAAFPDGLTPPADPAFAFVSRLAEPVGGAAAPAESSGAAQARFSPRFCYSYFAPYGDPLLDGAADPYPDGLLSALASAGVNGVWMQGLLEKLSPFPWAPERSTRFEERLRNLSALVERCDRLGIGVYLYFNEPRALPRPFFDSHPELLGVEELGYGALCTSVPEVREYVRSSVASVFRAAPGLGGAFTITASENLTNCWSHQAGSQCPRCRDKTRAEVIAAVNTDVRDGVRDSGSDAAVIAWDWVWPDDEVEEILDRLPPDVAVMSTSEWDLPIERGGVVSDVGEYCLSAVGPGPRAERHWAAARARGRTTLAKIQVGTTWECAAVPYLPVVANVARHVDNLRNGDVDGLMLSWTLGGAPSPALDVVGLLSDDPAMGVEEAMHGAAARRFGADAAAAVVEAWTAFSDAFTAFPFHIQVVYKAPLQMGPANLLLESKSGYAATMTGLPYDDVNAWRAIYPLDVYAAQLEEVADGFEKALAVLGSAARSDALDAECGVAEAAVCHFRSAANQARFVEARDALAAAAGAPAGPAASCIDRIEALLRSEMQLARRLYEVQCRDSRIGFEATNHYFYVPLDLVEKILNCEDLLERWVPSLRRRFATGPAAIL